MMGIKDKKNQSTKRVYPFKDNKGNVIYLSGSLTIKDLLKLGVRDIGFTKKEEPIKDGWFSNNGQCLEGPEDG